jgi:hypothetical protein
MAKDKEKDYLDFLEHRILELIALPIPDDKISSIQNLVSRYTSELREKIKNEKDPDVVLSEFKHYIKNILSIIETLISGEQFRALKRLLQNEIYSCCEIVTAELSSKKKK